MSRERIGILAAILSTTLGGTNTAVTRFAIGATDPVTLTAFRFGLGFLLLLPLALFMQARWPKGKDWLGVIALGVLFFAIFMGIFNLSLRYTTAARGALALATLPLLTMIMAAVLRAEPLTFRKTAGVATAIGGVATALLAGLARAPDGAWRGDLIMVAGALCMALYNVWSRPFIARSSSLAFVTGGMAAGSGCMALISAASGGLAASTTFSLTQWVAIFYLSVFGAALTFFLWVFALERTTPTRVANAITINPVVAALLAAPLLGEPIGANLLVGIVAISVGVWVASTDRRSGAPSAMEQIDSKKKKACAPATSAAHSGSGGRILHRAIARGGVLSLLGTRIAGLIEVRRSRRRLQTLDDRTLRDLGLGRSDVENDSTRTFWRMR
ncbi:MAG TPA: EamA family transporter [Stellaceae bacterium]|nr:EamA family transporter [Stellaceae bacterium]